MLYKKFKEVLLNFQENYGSHQKNIQVLLKLYKTSDKQKFLEIFVTCWLFLSKSDIITSKEYKDRTLFFLVDLANKIYMQKKQDDLNSSNPENDFNFLNEVVLKILRYSNNAIMSCRFFCCKFIALLLENIDENTILDDVLYDRTQELILKRVKDVKAVVRVQAVRALHRLQDPINNDCPVIMAFCHSICDGNPLVRKETVKLIAPCAMSIVKIVHRVSDVDYRVRQEAFAKCSSLKPTFFKIVDRQNILMAGFNETHISVKKCFIDVLLPKWLSAYNGNFLDLLTAIKLDADENDVETSATLSIKLMQTFFRNYPINDIIGCLPVEENKLLPIETLSNETISYWCQLHRYLCEISADELVDKIVPELSIFCNYIDHFIIKRFRSNFESWQALEYHFILRKLFEMASSFDLSDEVGRQTLHKLITTTLIENKLDIKTVDNIITIMSLMNENVDCLIGEVYDVICSIKDPSNEETLPTVQEVKEKEFEIAKLKVNIIELKNEIDKAVKEKNYMVADEKDVIQKKLQEKLNALRKPETVKTVTKPRDENDILPRCLDILICLLNLPCITKVNTNLFEIIREFENAATKTNSVDIFHRIYHIKILTAIIDRAYAEENLKPIFTPIIAYRLIPDGADEITLMYSIKGMSDLLRIYGANIFPEASQSQKKRKLYQITDYTEGSTDWNEIGVDDILEFIMYIQEDENPEIKETALSSLGYLLHDGISISSSIFSRIFLKWCNPLTEKMNPNVQQLLGMAIRNFAQFEGNSEVICSAVINILTLIWKAPKGSPLADVSIDNIINILALLTDLPNKLNLNEGHKTLAFNLCNEILNQPTFKCVGAYIKMLCALKFPEEIVTAKELLAQVDLILEEITDKISIHNLKKFKTKLLEKIETLTNENALNNEGEMESCDGNIEIRQDPDVLSNKLDEQNKNQVDEVDIDDATESSGNVSLNENSEFPNKNASELFPNSTNNNSVSNLSTDLETRQDNNNEKESTSRIIMTPEQNPKKKIKLDETVVSSRLRNTLRIDILKTNENQEVFPERKLRSTGNTENSKKAPPKLILHSNILVKQTHKKSSDNSSEKVSKVLKESNSATSKKTANKSESSRSSSEGMSLRRNTRSNDLQVNNKSKKTEKMKKASADSSENEQTKSQEENKESRNSQRSNSDGESLRRSTRTPNINGIKNMEKSQDHRKRKFLGSDREDSSDRNTKESRKTLNDSFQKTQIRKKGDFKERSESSSDSSGRNSRVQKNLVDDSTRKNRSSDNRIRNVNERLSKTENLQKNKNSNTSSSQSSASSSGRSTRSNSHFQISDKNNKKPITRSSSTKIETSTSRVSKTITRKEVPDSTPIRRSLSSNMFNDSISQKSFSPGSTKTSFSSTSSSSKENKKIRKSKRGREETIVSGPRSLSSPSPKRVKKPNPKYLNFDSKTSGQSDKSNRLDNKKKKTKNNNINMNLRTRDKRSSSQESIKNLKNNQTSKTEKLRSISLNSEDSKSSKRSLRSKISSSLESLSSSQSSKSVISASNSSSNKSTRIKSQIKTRSRIKEVLEESRRSKRINQ